MKALVYHGPGSKAWEEVPMPQIIDNTDAVVRVDCTTMCGSDLHILKGDVPEVTEGRILGHEAVGTVESVGAAVTHHHHHMPGRVPAAGRVAGGRPRVQTGRRSSRRVVTLSGAG
jgi:threonine dehydrogenase-like Zn-dependent dehydrogenase